MTTQVISVCILKRDAIAAYPSQHRAGGDYMPARAFHSRTYLLCEATYSFQSGWSIFMSLTGTAPGGGATSWRGE
jgi:hypothetical protein